MNAKRAAVAAVAAVMLAAGCGSSTQPKIVNGKLSHIWVENQLKDRNPTVVCNGGKDMPLVRHRTYYCNIHRGRYRFVPVSIVNPATGAFRFDTDDCAAKWQHRKCTTVIR